MYKLAEIVLFLTLFAPITRIEVAAVFCTKYAKNGSITRYCCMGSKGNGVNCTFPCPNGCANGICVRPQKCECNAGFVKKNGPSSPCEPSVPPLLSFHEPNCTHRCSNGTCVEFECAHTVSGELGTKFLPQHCWLIILVGMIVIFSSHK